MSWKVLGEISVWTEAHTYRDTDKLVRLLRDKGVKVKRMGLKEWLRSGF